MQLYYESIDGFGRIIWPDGRALLDQPVKLTRAFMVIRSALASLEKAPRG